MPRSTDRRNGFRLGLFAFLLATSATTQVAAGEWSGELEIDYRAFPDAPVDPRQHGSTFSMAVHPEWYADFDDGDQRIVFSPFLRLDEGDPERTHGDLREFYWRRSFDDAELYVGVRKIYWGVTESQHLVDVINQSDFVENLDAEDKLGQPMVSASFIRDWGTLDLYLMPYFRERTFPGAEGRLRFPLVVDTDQAIYESPDEEHHVDTAVRWSHYIGDYDIGIAHFHGTNREPRFTVDASGPVPALVPIYDIMDQTSLDLQATKGDWLWKLELITRDSRAGRHTAFTGGFEYTLWGVGGSQADMGLLVEYLFDDRGRSLVSPFQNDVFLGTRITANDVAGSELLAGVIVDADTQTTFGTVEASRRVGNDWRVELEARFFSGVEPTDPFFGFRRDDYVEFSFSQYW